jgi:outer membrane protein OmpA-like peptidoglycan-associated protein
MRAFIRPALVASAIVASLAAPPARAQSNPSADDIIQSLKPGGNLTQGLRGIKMAPAAGTTPASTAVATPAPAPAAKVSTAAPSRTTAPPPAADGAPSVSLTVEFASDSAELTPQTRQTLDQLGRALSSPDLAQFRFRIEGHTDTVGSPGYNKALSARRAAAVADYLEKNFAVAPSRLQPVGYGEDGLLVPTPPQTANAQNRRVKVVNLGG